METVVALGVFAVAVPLVLGAMGASMEVRRDAEVDTRAALIVRSITADLRQAYAGGGSIFHPRGDATRPRVPVMGDYANPAQPGPVLLVFDGAGAFVRSVSREEYATGMAGNQFGFLVELQGEAQPREAGLARVRLQVETPAAAAAAHRQKVRFMVMISTPASLDEN
jgi:hypothetical protein